jgi:hypothetical protein
VAGSPTASKLRQQIVSLRGERDRLEAAILQRRRMLDACLVERYGLAGGRERGSPAYYLSEKVEGKTRLTYVRKAELRRVRTATDAWREFSRALAQWVKVTVELERLLRQLGRAQVVRFPRRPSDRR